MKIEIDGIEVDLGEGFIKNSEGYYSELVKYHTKQKHEFIKIYLNIYTDNVSKKHVDSGNPGKIPSLDIIDLFSSFGFCHCDEIERFGRTDSPEWEGSAVLAANCLSNYYKPGQLILNSYHENHYRCALQVRNLESFINSINLKNKCNVTIMDHPLHNALSVALNEFNCNFPSVWILDPYKASDLPWHYIEAIAKRKGTKFDRQPEMIISFMSGGLQRNIERSKNLKESVFGYNETEFDNIFNELRKSGLNITETLVEMFAYRLSELYGHYPLISDITMTDESKYVYFVFFCSSHNSRHLMNRYKIEKYENWREKIWRPEAKRLILKRKEPNQTLIEDF